MIYRRGRSFPIQNQIENCKRLMIHNSRSLYRVYLKYSNVNERYVLLIPKKRKYQQICKYTYLRKKQWNSPAAYKASRAVAHVAGISRHYLYVWISLSLIMSDLSE